MTELVNILNELLDIAHLILGEGRNCNEGETEGECEFKIRVEETKILNKDCCSDLVPGQCDKLLNFAHTDIMENIYCVNSWICRDEEGYWLKVKYWLIGKCKS